ncbi:CHAD domain-containing protein [Agrobacterium sp. ES01]|uniref:CHAD domain-containing protein n=1 Tax=Agrobacterium sp. ES01 TaxID=3420714 RepID=UPI003D115C82
MRYRVKPGKPFTQEIRSLAQHQLRTAEKALTEQPDGLHEAIHEARKKFKRVRGLYRLIAKGQKEFRARENARLRDTAASLSVVRDATALVETLDYLAGFTETPEEAQSIEHARDILKARREEVADAATDLKDDVQAAIGSCQSAIEALSELNFDDHPKKVAKLLGKSWVKTLERAHSNLAECQDNVHAEAFHELRKTAQTYWMYNSLLRDIWPSAMNAKRSQTKALVDLLGHEHDITLLVELLNLDASMLGVGEELSHLLGVIIRQQQILRREALTLAASVFQDTPEREANTISTLWMAASDT